jgi:hypothetical protein
MTSTNTALVVAGVGVGGVILYYVLKPKDPLSDPAVIAARSQAAQDMLLALQRTQYGAAAVAKTGSGGLPSLLNQVSSGTGSVFAAAANTILPGSGGIVGSAVKGVTGSILKVGETVGSSVVNGLKKLWPF